MYKVLVFIALVSCLVSGRGHAAMTDWAEVQGGAVRLIADGPLHEGHYLAGLEFLLEPGWHTYWRYPGEAGIPPQISIEAQVLDSTCSKPILGEYMRAVTDGAPSVTQVGMIVPDCDAVGEYLVLKNLPADLTIARN